MSIDFGIYVKYGYMLNIILIKHLLVYPEASEKYVDESLSLDSRRGREMHVKLVDIRGD